MEWLERFFSPLLFADAFYSDRKYRIEKSLMDEYCIQYVLSGWYDFIGDFSELHTHMATSSAVVDCTCIFTRFLLLVCENRSHFYFPFDSVYYKNENYCGWCTILYFAVSYKNRRDGWLARDVKQPPIVLFSIRNVIWNSQRKWRQRLRKQNKRCKQTNKQSLKPRSISKTNCQIYFQANEANQNKSKMQRIFKELNALYGPPRLRRMALICHYTWCVTALSYYVTALNADNLAANRVIYVAATGAVDFVSLILSMTLLKFFGRKISSCGLFAMSGFFLLSLIVLPRGLLHLMPSIWETFLCIYLPFSFVL